MNNKNGYKVSFNDYDAEVFCKSRVIDPLRWKDGEIKKVLQIEPSWSFTVKREIKPKRYLLKFID